MCGKLKLFYAFLAALLMNAESQFVKAQDSQLEGSTELVFQIDQEVAADRGLELNTMLVKRVTKQAQARVDQVSLAEKISANIEVAAEIDSNRIVVKIPSEVTPAQLNSVKSSLLNSVWIEFALLANEVRHAELIAFSEQSGNHNKKRVYRGDELVGLWYPVALNTRDKPKINPSGKVATRKSPQGKDSPLEYLVVVDPVPGLRLTSRYFEKVEKQKSERGLMLSFQLDMQGGTLMQNLTSKNLPVSNRPEQAGLGIEDGVPEAVPELARDEEEVGYRARLAIIIDGQIHMAPMIYSVISTSGVAEGNITDKELDALLESLNLAPIEVPLLLIEESEQIHESKN